MAETRSSLSQEGFTAKEVDEILWRAAELQHQAEQKQGAISRVALEGGAEAAGIPGEFVEQAIQELKAEREREAAQRAERRRILTTAGIAGAVILVILVLFSHRALNSRLAEMEEKQAQLENVLQRRYDLIPNLIAISKSYAAHEKELIASVSDVYQRLVETGAFEQRQTLEQELGEGIVKLMAAIRTDPRASSIALFIRLSDEMAGAENRIAVERKRYNEAVAAYNRTARSFPVYLVRPWLSFPESIAFFQAPAEARHPLRF
jgi:Uncharacterized conserved protein